jgi:uncharacterized protein
VRRVRSAHAQPLGQRRRRPTPQAPLPAPTLPLAPTVQPDPSSPTMSIRTVLGIFAVAALVASLLSTPALVHAGYGMPDGFERTVTLAVGRPLLAITDALGITVPFNALQGALGRTVQAQSPLLADTHPTSRATQAAAAGQQGGRLPGKRTQPTRHVPALAPIHPPTARHPLRLLVTGDSLTEFIGPQLVDYAAHAGPVRGTPDTHYGTGLVRPDFVDWSTVARQQVQTQHPQAIVVMMGGNDFQNIQLADGRILYSGTRAWTAEYQRRAAVCMRIWAQGGHARVYWLSMPPARDASWSAHNAEINTAIRGAARQVPGARFVNILGPITVHGRYSDFVTVNGSPVLIREPDGIHLNTAGSAIVAHEVLQLLERQWHFGRRHASAGRTK